MGLFLYPLIIIQIRKSENSKTSFPFLLLNNIKNKIVLFFNGK